MSCFPLMDLPAELRQLILSFLPTQGSRAAISTTCKLLHQEVERDLYHAIGPWSKLTHSSLKRTLRDQRCRDLVRQLSIDVPSPFSRPARYNDHEFWERNYQRGELLGTRFFKWLAKSFTLSTQRVFINLRYDATWAWNTCSHLMCHSRGSST